MKWEDESQNQVLGWKLLPNINFQLVLEEMNIVSSLCFFLITFYHSGYE